MLKVTVEMIDDDGRNYIEIVRPMQEILASELLMVFRDATLALSYHENSWDDSILSLAEDISASRRQRELKVASSKGEL